MNFHRQPVATWDFDLEIDGCRMILTESTLFGMFFLEDLIDLGMKLLCPKKLIHLGSVPKVIILFWAPNIFWGEMVQFSSISEMVNHTVDGSENPSNHLGCIKPCK